MLGWENDDCKWEQIAEVKISATALLLDCSPFVFTTNIAGQTSLLWKFLTILDF